MRWILYDAISGRSAPRAPVTPYAYQPHITSGQCTDLESPRRSQFLAHRASFINPSRGSPCDESRLSSLCPRLVSLSLSLASRSAYLGCGARCARSAQRRVKCYAGQTFFFDSPRGVASRGVASQLMTVPSHVSISSACDVSNDAFDDPREIRVRYCTQLPTRHRSQGIAVITDCVLSYRRGLIKSALLGRTASSNQTCVDHRSHMHPGHGGPIRPANPECTQSHKHERPQTNCINHSMPCGARADARLAESG
jgi:hypothetical protein